MYTAETIKLELPYYQEMLLFYKVSPCLSGHTKPHCDLLPIIRENSQYLCFHYHNPAERRRKPFDDKTSILLYQPIKCPFIAENSMCPDEDACQYSHTQTEIDYHPLFYKTEPCQGCQFESNTTFCPFFHSDENNRKVMLEKFQSRLIKDIPLINQDHSEVDGTSSSLDSFKTKLCPLKGNHNPKICEYYHHDKDRRRATNIFNYSVNLCPYLQKNEFCPNGDHCDSCHNKVEQLYHPQRYKKKFCTEHPHNLQKCEYGNYCSFAHSEAEIRIELLHNMKKDNDFYLLKYKTVFCPYIYAHDRNQCVYAHNPQDFRRDPSKFNYNPIQCANWSKKQIFSYEEGGCPDHMECKQCHGWKELEYHPMYYKTEPCHNTQRCTKKDCPFYHSSTEQRKNIKKQSIAPRHHGQNSVQYSIFPGKDNVHVPRTGHSIDFTAQQSNLAKKITKAENYQANGFKTPTNETLFQGAYGLRNKRSGEASTRPNSNISTNYLMEDSYHQEKKKKGKNNSLQTKTDKLMTSPVAIKLDKQKGLSVGNGMRKDSSVKFYQQEEKKPFYNSGSNEEEQETELEDDYEELHSFTDEENVVVNNKPSDIASTQFLKNLFLNLEKKGFESAVHQFRQQNVDAETLKSLCQNNINLFPQIPQGDREKIIKIIEDTLEGEDILSKVNTHTLQEEFLGISLSQADVEENELDAMFGVDQDHDNRSIYFNYNFFQGNTY